MKKVNLFDKALRKQYYAVVTAISVVITIMSITITIPNECKLYVFVGMSTFFLIIYIILWLRANSLEKVKLKINNSILEVKIGDIFNQNNLKVIVFNEYFDTIVDDIIVTKSSINGIYLENIVEDIDKLNTQIYNNEHCNSNIIGANDSRIKGNKKKYKLGTIHKNNEYLLTAFSRCDGDNRSYLHMNDYINFLLNLWNEIDIVYAGRSISIPLIGSGITRFKDSGLIEEQELLELIIWSFKVSKIKIKHPSKVVIVIHESIKDKINFFRLKNIYD